MSISIRLNQEDEKLIREYANLKHISLSDLLRNSVMEKIEDEIDLQSFEKAMKDMKKTYSMEEVKKELGL
ncbi:MAG: CopG family transcriptional regulator [Leptotrichiaceae bacterium]|nr:CopG family transcriptional regulator [Leptotrichiaceae bacterium]